MHPARCITVMHLYAGDHANQTEICYKGKHFAFSEDETVCSVRVIRPRATLDKATSSELKLGAVTKGKHYLCSKIYNAQAPNRQYYLKHR
eukprot:scaffold243567_cov17-Prasinocladus_malaysianus.AAC.1